MGCFQKKIEMKEVASLSMQKERKTAKLNPSQQKHLNVLKIKSVVEPSFQKQPRRRCMKLQRPRTLLSKPKPGMIEWASGMSCVA